MVPEARLERTEHGLVAKTEGWFVLNARDARWSDRGPRGARCDFEGDVDFAQLGVHLYVLGPRQPMSMYHWENEQEDFLVLAGEALLIVEGEERPLATWDFVHCPREAAHTIVGAGSGPCVVVAVGSRTAPDEDWGGYPVDEAARRHDASAEAETRLADEAYARFPRQQPSAYREGWLPDLR